MTSTRTETIAAADGGTFDGYLALPDHGSGPGLLVLQEIFGVNEYIRDVAERVAELGYVAMAPDLFWRIEPNVEFGHTPEELERAISFASKFDGATGISDVETSLAHLRGLAENTGGTGVLGFCFGGRMAYLTAAQLDPDVAISYYGAGIGEQLDIADGITCPMIFQYGGNDDFIPKEEIDAVRAFAEAKPDIDVYVYDGGHAFDNHTNSMFHDAIPAAQAWAVTTNFLSERLPAEPVL